MNERILHAWVDESVHLDAEPSGIYVLAATIGAVGPALEQARARRKCLERLLCELSVRGVSRVWLESRDRKLDQMDINLVDIMRIKRGIGPSLQAGFGRPLDEPMLWVPDAVAGAVALARKGRNPGFREALESKLQEIEV